MNGDRADAVPQTPSARHLAETWASVRDLGVGLVHGSALVAGASGLSLLAIGSLLGLRVEVGFLSIVVLGIAAVYGFNHLVEWRGDRATNPERARSISRWRVVHGSLFAACVVGALAVPVVGGRAGALGWVSALLSLGLLYSLGGKGLTRKIPAFKTFYVGAMYGALVPFCSAYHGGAPSTAVAALAFVVGLDAALNATFCDLKDSRSDADEGLRAVPVMLGRDGTLRVLAIGNGLWCGLVVLTTTLGVLPSGAVALLAVGAFRGWYVAVGYGADERRLRRLAGIADLDSFVWWGATVVVWVAFRGGLRVPPWPALPALDGLPWGTPSRTPLIGYEIAGSLACSGCALALGAALSYMDRARDAGGLLHHRSRAVFAAGAFLSVALMGLNACFATIALSLVIGAAAAGSIRMPVHVAGAVLVAVICLALQAPRLEPGALALLCAAAAADETLLRVRLRRAWSGVLGSVPWHRPLWKAALFALTFTAGWPVRYAVAAVAFDLGYAWLDRSLAPAARTVGSVNR